MFESYPVNLQSVVSLVKYVSFMLTKHFRYSTVSDAYLIPRVCVVLYFSMHADLTDRGLG